MKRLTFPQAISLIAWTFALAVLLHGSIPEQSSGAKEYNLNYPPDSPPPARPIEPLPQAVPIQAAVVEVQGPPAPAQFPTAPPPINAATLPLSVSIHGPAEVVEGNQTIFLASTTGDVRSIKWRVKPTVPLEISVDGKIVKLVATAPGDYRINCMVGSLLTIDDTEFEFAVLERASDRPPLPQPPPTAQPTAQLTDPDERPITNADMKVYLDFLTRQTNTPAVIHPPSGQDLRSFVRQAIATVPDPARKANATILAGSYSLAAGPLRTGTFSGGNPLDQVRTAATQALGPQATALWAGFFQNIANAYSDLHAKGLMGNNGAVADFLSSVATELRSTP